MEESKIKTERVRKPRATNVVLSDDLKQRNYETEEERKLIEAVLSGKNRGIGAIVKDANLRKVWMSSFFKKNILTKTSVKKIDLPAAMKKIEEIKGGLSMQHKSILLAGLGEVLKKKYNLTEEEVKNLLKIIHDPVSKTENEKEQEKEGERKTQKKMKPREKKEKPFNLYNLLDISSLFIPMQAPTSNYLSENSTLSSKIFGQPMSGDGQIIQRDNQIHSDIERSYYEHGNSGSGDPHMLQEPRSGSDPDLNLNLRNMSSPDDALGEIGKGMLMNGDQGSDEVGFNFDNEMHDGNMGDYNDQMLDMVIHPNMSLNEGNIQKLDLPNLEASENLPQWDDEDKKAKMKNSRRLQETLVRDTELHMDVDMSGSTYSLLRSSSGDNKLEGRLTIYLTKKKADMINERDEEESYLTPFYSTDDESGNEQHKVETVIQECRNLPLKIERKLQVIKEETEDQINGGDMEDFNLDEGLDGFMNENEK